MQISVSEPYPHPKKWSAFFVNMLWAKILTRIVPASEKVDIIHLQKETFLWTPLLWLLIEKHNYAVFA